MSLFRCSGIINTKISKFWAVFTPVSSTPNLPQLNLFWLKMLLFFFFPLVFTTVIKNHDTFFCEQQWWFFDYFDIFHLSLFVFIWNSSLSHAQSLYILEVRRASVTNPAISISRDQEKHFQLVSSWQYKKSTYTYKNTWAFFWSIIQCPNTSVCLPENFFGSAAVKE